MQYCNDLSWTSVATVVNGADPCGGALAGTTKYRNGEIQFCNGTSWVSTDSTYSTGTACTDTGKFIYNNAKNRMEWCNGTVWKIMGKIGFFVFPVNSSSPSDLAAGGADSWCLNELNSYGFKGKTVPWFGTLTAARVRAWVCYSSGCQNLTPYKTYAFASIWSPTSGGALITADSAGLGPYDNLTWHDDAHFGTAIVGGGTKPLWTGRTAGSNSQVWSNTYNTTGSCSNWTTTLGTSSTGTTDSTGTARWGGGSTSCGATARFICMVD